MKPAACWVVCTFVYLWAWFALGEFFCIEEYIFAPGCREQPWWITATRVSLLFVWVIHAMVVVYLVEIKDGKE